MNPPSLQCYRFTVPFFIATSLFESSIHFDTLSAAMPSLSKLAVGLTAFFLIPSALSKACPPLGPVLPPPKSPSSSDAIREAAEELTSGLESQLTSKLKTSGVSIGVKSIHEDEQLFSYHFTPPDLSGIGTDKIDETTIFRVGSLSKLSPALALLQNPSVDMRDSVLKYIPELRDVKGGVDWEEVTLESLTDHLAGVATDSKSCFFYLASVSEEGHN